MTNRSEAPLYIPLPGAEPLAEPSWSARFRLPEVMPRALVLEEIERGTRAMRYSTEVPLADVDTARLSGVLIGPEGDHDAEEVQDVLFDSEYSRRFGVRPSHHSDRHAKRIADVNNWVEVSQERYATAGDPGKITRAGMTRIINGRNKDRYGGKEAFTYDEARGMLSSDRFTTQGGYLFSMVPSWKESYGEPAIILTMPDRLYDLEAEQELFKLNKGLNWQHRFVRTAPYGVEVFEANEDHPDFPPELRSK